MIASRLSLFLLFLVTWLAIFAQSQFTGFRDTFAIPFSIVPALLAYTARTHGLGITTCLALLSGLWIDSLSISPIGVSSASLFLIAFGLQFRRHLILREQTYAQFWIGFAAGFLAHFLILVLLSVGPIEPVISWFSLWKISLLGFLNALVCPLAFVLFDTLSKTFDYHPIASLNFRADRETVRGRHSRNH